MDFWEKAVPILQFNLNKILLDHIFFLTDWNFLGRF